LNEAEASVGPKKSFFWECFVVSITNPKTIFFYVAYFTQFIKKAGAKAQNWLD
jgi:threonine/homoserine/homoserine lactone efflux protein